MSQQLISHSPDLAKLRNEGYDVAVVAGHLVVRGVPYVTPARTVARGMLISTLMLAGDRTTQPETHVVFFAGETPCKATGSPLTEMIIAGTHHLAQDLVANFQFSHKPPGGYANYYDKMTAYANILVSEASVIEPNSTAMTFSVITDEEDASPFVYLDTASSRAGIAAISNRLRLSKVAIVGLGGTGSYILDLVAKTPVVEIHLYDGDVFLQHNAFRSPGAPSVEQLAASPKKTDYWADLYSRMRRGVVSHPTFVTEANLDELSGFAFVFLALDGGEAKRRIVEHLTAHSIPFTDVGMGIYENDGKLAGLVATTSSTRARQDHAFARIPFSDGDGRNEYARNIQIADLNALSAAFAVVKWKKQFGVYDDFEEEHYSLYAISDNSLVNEERSTEDEDEGLQKARAA